MNAKKIKPRRSVSERQAKKVIVGIGASAGGRTEEALRKSEELFRSITSNTPDHILVQDLELRYLLVVNSQLGLTEKDMIGKTDHDILTKDDADAITKIKRRVIETATPAHLEAPFIDREGNQQLFEGSYIPKHDAQGRVDGLIGYFRNVTQQKRAEENLRQTKDYLDKLIQYANAPIIVWDPKMRITRFNGGFEKLTGWKENEILGEHLSRLFPDESRDASMEKIGRSHKGEHWEYVEIPILCKDGGVKLALWNSANVYDEDGATLLATIAQGTDITERKRAEEEIQRHAEELRKSNEELERFNRAMVDRELRMIELKKQVNELYAKLGEPPRYETDFEEEK